MIKMHKEKEEGEEEEENKKGRRRALCSLFDPALAQEKPRAQAHSVPGLSISWLSS